MRWASWSRLSASEICIAHNSVRRAQMVRAQWQRAERNLQCLWRGELDVDIGHFKCVTSETRQLKANMFLSLLPFPAEMTLWAMCFRWFSYQMVAFLLAWIPEWQCGAELPFDLHWGSLWSFIAKIPGLICFCRTRTLPETQVQRFSAGFTMKACLKRGTFWCMQSPSQYLSACNRPGNRCPNRKASW